MYISLGHISLSLLMALSHSRLIAARAIIMMRSDYTDVRHMKDGGAEKSHI